MAAVIRGQTIGLTFRVHMRGILADPNRLLVKLVAPDGTRTEFEYGAPPAGYRFSRTGQGEYSLEFEPQQAGTWVYRVEARGDAVAVAEGRFEVRESFLE
jgi:hypothetical protein